MIKPINELVDFGLTTSEAEVFWILLANGRPMSANEVSEESNLIRHYIFQLLSQLSKRGFVEEIPERPRKYSATLKVLSRRIFLLDQLAADTSQKLSCSEIPNEEKLIILQLDNYQIDIYYNVLRGINSRKELVEETKYSYDIVRNRTEKMLEMGLLECRKEGNQNLYFPVPLEIVIQQAIETQNANWIKTRTKLENNLEKLRMILSKGQDQILHEETDIILLRNQEQIMNRIQSQLSETDRVYTTFFIHVSHNVELFSDLANQLFKTLTDAAKRGAEIRCLVEDFFPFLLSSVDENIIIDFLTCSSKVDIRITPFPMPCFIIMDEVHVFEFPPISSILEQCILFTSRTLTETKTSEFLETWDRASDLRPYLRDIVSKEAWNKINDSLAKNPRFLFKIVVCGPAAVGKTTLIRRFFTNKFIPRLKLTMGVDLKLRSYLIEINNTIYNTKLQIWDFGGEERFRILLPEYSRGANGVIYTCDSTDPRTIVLLGEYVDLVEKELVSKEQVTRVLISTKHDLETSLSDKEIKDFHDRYEIKKYYKTSSVTGEGVEELFKDIAITLVKKRVNIN